MNIHSTGMLLSPKKEKSNQCISPKKPEPFPYIIPNPTIQKKKEPTIKSTKFFISMLAVFLYLVNPASTKANPGRIKKNSIEAISTHTVSRPLTIDMFPILHYFLTNHHTTFYLQGQYLRSRLYESNMYCQWG